jgi:hypothetical protein
VKNVIHSDRLSLYVTVFHYVVSILPPFQTFEQYFYIGITLLCVCKVRYEEDFLRFLLQGECQDPLVSDDASQDQYMPSPYPFSHFSGLSNAIRLYRRIDTHMYTHNVPGQNERSAWWYRSIVQDKI